MPPELDKHGPRRPSNQWTHIAVTYSRGVVKTYADGASVHTHSGSGQIGNAHPSEDELRVGGRQAVPQHFAGRIDEARIYSRALSAAEVSAVAGQAAGGGWSRTSWALRGWRWTGRARWLV